MGCTDASTFCRAGVADTPETSVLQIRGVAELRRRDVIRMAFKAVLVKWGMPTLLTTVLDSPEHMTR